MNKAAGGIGYKQVACEVHTVLLSGFSLVCGAGDREIGHGVRGDEVGRCDAHLLCSLHLHLLVVVGHCYAWQL